MSDMKISVTPVALISDDIAYFKTKLANATSDEARDRYALQIEVLETSEEIYNSSQKADK